MLRPVVTHGSRNPRSHVEDTRHPGVPPGIRTLAVLGGPRVYVGREIGAKQQNTASLESKGRSITVLSHDDTPSNYA